MNLNNCSYLKEQMAAKEAAREIAKMSKLRFLRDKNL
jgi:hypothetical protein